MSFAAAVTHPARGDTLDLILLAALAGYAFIGYRRGLVAGVFSLAGFVGGVVLGSVVAPPVARGIFGPSGWQGTAQRVLALVVVAVVAVVGEHVAGFVGRRIGSVIAFTPARWADRLAGAVFSVVGLLFGIWVVSYALASAPYRTVSDQVRRSAIVHGVDDVMPTSVSDLFADLNRLVRRHNSPATGHPLGQPAPPTHSARFWVA